MGAAMAPLSSVRADVNLNVYLWCSPWHNDSTSEYNAQAHAQSNVAMQHDQCMADPANQVIQHSLYCRISHLEMHSNLDGKCSIVLRLTRHVE